MVWKHVWPRFSCFAKQNAIFLSLHYIHTGDAPRNHRPFIFLSDESSRRKHAAWGVQQLEVQQAHPPWNGRTMDQASWTFPSSTWTLGSREHFLASNVPLYPNGGSGNKTSLHCPPCVFGFWYQWISGQTPLKSIKPLEGEQDSGRTFVTYGSSFANTWPRSHSDWNAWDPWGSRERGASIKDYARCLCHMH